MALSKRGYTDTQIKEWLRYEFDPPCAVESYVDTKAVKRARDERFARFAILGVTALILVCGFFFA